MSKRPRSTFEPISMHAFRGASSLYRRCLLGPRIIAVTGSCGKTTTTHLIHSILGIRGTGTVSHINRNGLSNVERKLWAARPWHDYQVQEVSGHAPGVIEPQVRFIRPHIGVVTTIGNDHFRTFRGPEGAAKEKGKLIENLPARGTAVLNVDDPDVAELAARTWARVVTYGRSAEAMVRGSRSTVGSGAASSIED
jgi:UDP-N-acetylmuramoyl-tripeptide--D-alanyl-D-alanine ligase